MAMHRFIDGEDRMQQALLPHSLKSQSAKGPICYTIGAVICSLPRASLRLAARFDLLFR